MVKTTKEHDIVTPLLIACGAHLNRLEKAHGLAPMTAPEYEHYTRVEEDEEPMFDQLTKQGHKILQGGSIWDVLTGVVKGAIPTVANAIIPGSGGIASAVSGLIGLGEGHLEDDGYGGHLNDGGDYHIGGEYPIAGSYDIGGKYIIGGKEPVTKRKRGQKLTGDFIDPAFNVTLAEPYRELQIGHYYTIEGTTYQMTQTGLQAFQQPTPAKTRKAPAKKATGGAYIDETGNIKRPAKVGLLGSTRGGSAQRVMSLQDFIQ